MPSESGVSKKTGVSCHPEHHSWQAVPTLACHIEDGEQVPRHHLLPVDCQDVELSRMAMLLLSAVGLMEAGGVTPSTWADMP
jgi:hypothetical protein